MSEALARDACSGSAASASAGKSREDLYAELRIVFRANGIEPAEIEARAILLHGLGIDWQDLIVQGRERVGEAQCGYIRALSERRLAGEPLAYVLGEKEFWGRSFAVDKSTLIPRPDTEVIVEASLRGLDHLTSELAGDDILTILDLGTGSGAILLSLLAERSYAFGLGMDVDPDALLMAKHNSGRLGVAPRCRFVCGRWADPLAWSTPDGARDSEGADSDRFARILKKRRGFDLIVANPPYVCDAEWHTLAPQVRDFEPKTALHGGQDGLDSYRQLRTVFRRLLRPGGAFVVEHGFQQQKSVSDILFDNRELIFWEDLQDLARRDRGLVGRRSFS